MHSCILLFIALDDNLNIIEFYQIVNYQKNKYKWTKEVLQIHV